MLTRRHLLLGLGASACTRSSEQTRSTKPTWPRTTTQEGVEVIELFPNDADESSPLIVAIHGMGDRPDRWVDDWRTFPARVQIALPRAFNPYGNGFSWFKEGASGMSDEELGAEVGNAESRLWTGIMKLAGQRKVIVTGFSQGGMLSYTIAARHPDRVIRAFPVSGLCPVPLLPQNKARAAPITAFHGTADRVLNVKWGRAAINAFKEQGNEAELREYPDVGHSITRQMHQDLWDAIARALPPS